MHLSKLFRLRDPSPYPPLGRPPLRRAATLCSTTILFTRANTRDLFSFLLLSLNRPRSLLTRRWLVDFQSVIIARSLQTGLRSRTSVLSTCSEGVRLKGIMAL